MSLPSLDEFFGTLTEEEKNSWFDKTEKLKFNVSKNEKGDTVIDISNYSECLLSFSRLVLSAYHEWISKQG